MSDLLNEREAARYLSLSARTLRQWRWQQRGPRFVRLEGAIRYQRSDLQAFIEKGAQ